MTACIVYDCREGRGEIYREYTVLASHLFVLFSRYPINFFYLLVIIIIIIGKYGSTSYTGMDLKKNGGQV